jgi:putative hydrolase of the HAD superfamily
MKEFQSIKYWLFDLDNTLYSGKTKVFEQVDKKMTQYISQKINISLKEAKEMQKKYFHKYNTTLNGLIKNHKVNANEFLDFVHDINIDFLEKDEQLGAEINKLNGKKIIFTNGSKKHAMNITKKIGVDQYFDDIFDIVDCEFIPKPMIEPYKKLVQKHKVDPNLCVFIEDIARNLKPAYEMGMKTIWIENDEPWAKEFSDSKFINYKTNNLSEFLKKINIEKAA